MAVPREWQAALGLQDCMVVVGGRADIPDFEPIPLSCDTMCSAVEILWYRAPPQAHPPTGMFPCLHHLTAFLERASSASVPIFWD